MHGYRRFQRKDLPSQEANSKFISPHAEVSRFGCAARSFPLPASMENPKERPQTHALTKSLRKSAVSIITTTAKAITYDSSEIADSRGLTVDMMVCMLFVPRWGRRSHRFFCLVVTQLVYCLGELLSLDSLDNDRLGGFLSIFVELG